MKTRDPVKTRNEILNVAFWEIYRNGFHNVSINDILAKTTLTKGAFFHYFPTKNDLGYAIVDEILTQMILDRWIKPLAAYKNPMLGITTNLKKILDNSPPETLSLGCPLNNLIQEMSNVDPIFRDKLQKALDLWINEIEKYVKKAQDQDFIKKNIKTRQVAEFIVTTHEGGFGLMKSYRHKKIFYSLNNSLKVYINSLLT